MSLSRRKFLKISSLSALAAGFAGAGGLVYASTLEAEMIEIVPVELTLPRLSPLFDGYRIAQISDIHMGTGMTAEKLSLVADMVNATYPNLIALTGDFVTRGVDGYVPHLIEPLRRFDAPDGVVAVMGNHDYISDNAGVREALHTSGVLNVSNGIYTLERDGAFFHIAGVDTIWYEQDRLDLVLEQLPDEGAAMLLAHEPDFADTSAATGRFDLQISGHSHGGQINLPLIGPPVTPPHGRKYPLGQYQVGEMFQYTNRGIGTTGLALRLNCRPEITVFTLRAV